MKEHSDSYNPSSDIREVGMRITVGLDTQDRYDGVHVTLSDLAFTDDSDPQKLFDGDTEEVAIKTIGNEYSKYFYLYFSTDYPPEYVKLYLAQDSPMPSYIMTTWYKISETSIGWYFPEAGTRVVTFNKPNGFGQPTSLLVGFGDPGISLCEIELAPPMDDIVLTQSEIISAEISEEVDVSAEKFPKRTLDFEASAIGFNPELLPCCTGKSVKTEISVNGEYIHTGDFFIDEAVSINGGAGVRVHCSDIVTRMEKFMTGLTTGGVKTLSEVLNYGSGAAAFVEFDMDDYSANAVFCADMYTEIDTQENCLLLAAQAANISSIWVNRDGVVRISCLTRGSGYVKEIQPDDVIEYSEYSVNDRVEYVEVTGENSSGVTAANSGNYYQACMMAFLKNDFFTPSSAQTLANNYIAAKNYRLNAVLKLRCDPALEVADRVKLIWKDQSDMGEFIVASQKISFDESGLSSVVKLCAPLPEVYDSK